MQNGVEKNANSVKINFIKFASPIFIIICIILTCIISPNFEFRKVKKEDLAQYQFAEIINQKPQATLLNYYYLDAGFYTVTGITPNVKYFFHPNIDDKKYVIIVKEQIKYIKDKVIDFVVTVTDKEEDTLTIPYLYENYNKIKSKYDEGIKGYYMLFEKK